MSDSDLNQNPEDMPKEAEKLSESWSSEVSTRIKEPLFTTEELDIYTNKVTHEAFIFHSKKIDYDKLDRLEYDAKKYTLTVHYKDQRAQDLGVKIQWILRPYLKHASEVNVARTENKEVVDATVLPLVHTHPKA